MNRAIPEQVPRAPAEAPDWAARMLRDVVAWIQARDRGPQMLTAYTVAGVPNAVQYANHAIIVSNESAGRTIATSDGTAWKRVKDGATIS